MENALTEYKMTQDTMTAFIDYETAKGASANMIRRFSGAVKALYEYLPEDKIITKDRLLSWRKSMEEHGYAAITIMNYAKYINRYLDFAGYSEIRFNRGKAKDISGMTFGYLTAIEPTSEKNRKDLIWRCICKCGNEVEYPATRLLTGNTLSCGCLRGEHLQEVNKYFEGTSLRKSIEEHVYSTRAQSGYTGVTTKRGKWQAYICYKGQSISLGCYTKLEDAVKARARGKELVQMDAMGLLNFYEEIHKDDPARPAREQIKNMQKQIKNVQPKSSETKAVRSNNTSGYPGVSKKRNKWTAKITHMKVTYQLGSYDEIDQAIRIRKEAEQMLQKDPDGFPKWIRQQQKTKTVI